MEIIRHPGEHRYALRLQGRFDANWATHVGNAVDEVIRGGYRHIELDLAGVNYISSAGVRILFKTLRALTAAGGSLRVSSADANVTGVIEMSGLASLLEEQAPPAAPVAVTWESEGTIFEEHALESAGPMSGRIYGEPLSSFAGVQSRPLSRLSFGSQDIGVGIAAFGPPDDVDGRFGEWLAAGGATLAMPTDGSSVPDYLIAEARHVPQATLLTGITARGSFDRLYRFESRNSTRGTICWSALIGHLLLRSGHATAAFAAVTETAGVVGASLLRSPTAPRQGSLFAFPAVRDWLSFTGESDEQRSVSLLTGFASRESDPVLAPHIRPLGKESGVMGHFHAAIFPYRPLPGGKVDLPAMASELASSGMAKTVLHLLGDEREIGGVGETEMMRGAVWMAPVGFDAGEGMP